MDGIENDEPPQRPSLIRAQRHRLPLTRKSLAVSAWVLLFGAGVIIGGVLIGQSRPQPPANETDEVQSGQSFTTSDAGNNGNGSSSAKDEDEYANDMATNVPTSMPLALQDISTTDPATTGQACDVIFDCISDRLGQNELMSAGQAICSRDGRYAFAMELSSSNVVSLVWKDCATGDTKKYYQKGETNDYFVMNESAKFAVYGSGGEVKWEKECLVSVNKYPRCLSKPEYDCPYLHLHRGGVVVLNYIDGWDWISKNIKKMYNF